jgi:hypothetical protein
MDEQAGLWRMDTNARLNRHYMVPDATSASRGAGGVRGAAPFARSITEAAALDDGRQRRSTARHSTHPFETPA